MATLKRTHDQRGATLFEAIVAVFIFSSLILMLTLTLFTEAGRRIQSSGERAGERDAGRVVDRIRTDVWGASSIVVPLDYDPYGTWYEGPLILSGHWSGYEMGYGVQGKSLFRIIRRPGQEAELAEVLRGVDTFHWRFLDGVSRTAVVLEILRSESPTFRGPDDAPAGPSSVADRIVLSPRRVRSARW